MSLNVPPERDHEEALTRLRAACHELEAHVQAVDSVTERFLQLLRTSSQELLYRYESTQEKLHDASESLAEQLQFLTDRRHSGTKLYLGEHVFNRVTFASFVVKELGDKECEADPVVYATELLKARCDKQTATSAKLESERESLLSAVKAMCDHVGRSYRLGLARREEQTANDLLACLWFAFDVGLLRKVERRRQTLRAKELLSKEHMAMVFERLIKDYRLALDTQLRGAVNETRKKHLQEAANCWVETLLERTDMLVPEDACTQTMTAICGLHFAYACQQKLDYGKMSPELQKNYRVLLERVPADTVSVAVRRLLEENILDDRAFELFRYVPSVRDAYVAVREECPSMS